MGEISWYEPVKKEAEGLHCPFCGKESMLEVKKSEHDGYYIECKSCMANGPHALDIEEAISRWNRRNTTPASDMVFTPCVF